MPRPIIDQAMGDTLIASPVEIQSASCVIFHCGELVVARTDAFHSLLEVIRVEPDGLVRVRGLAWPAGYTALMPAANVQPAGRLALSLAGLA